MREMLVIQTGQCGNQIGTEFWRTVLREHSLHGTSYTDAMSTFFRNVNQRGHDLPLYSTIANLKARSVVIDMEEGVVNALLGSDLGGIFDESLIITDPIGRGSGNNFAEGYKTYGEAHGDRILEVVRKTIEACDSPQGFLFFSSLGGGTGSGLGARAIELISEAFEGLSILSAPIIPSRETDDVVTSPYNTIFSMASLATSADVIIPFDNESITNCVRMLGEKKINPDKAATQAAKVRGVDPFANQQEKGQKRRPFKEVNQTVATALSCITSSMRFGGEMNVDLNELAINLVPFPELNFVCTSLAPLPMAPPAATIQAAVRNLLLPQNQLILSTGTQGPSFSLATAILARGENINSGELSSAVARLQSAGLVHPSWGSQGVKIGLSGGRPPHASCDAVCLRNGPQILETVGHVKSSFDKMRKSRMYLHHYEKILGAEEIEFRSQVVDTIIQGYQELSRTRGERRVVEIDVAPVVY